MIEFYRYTRGLENSVSARTTYSEDPDVLGDPFVWQEFKDFLYMHAS